MSYNHLALTRDGEVTVLELASGKTNPLSVALVDELHHALDAVESDEGARALVLTGGASRFFSYGLDVPNLIALDRPAMTRFLGEFNRLLARLYGFPRPTVAAVNGHAMAGGLLLALTADARIGTEGDYAIALPEVKLGLAAPSGSLRMMARRLGDARTAELALGGHALTPGRAVEAGILEELVPPVSLLERAAARARALCDAPASAFAFNKSWLTRGVFETDPGADAGDEETWLDRWFAPGTQALLRKLADRK